MSDQPQDIGQVLKSTREQKGLTLDMIHEATKIPIDSLKAIEEGYKVRTLTPFYYKSFVRIYAQQLNIAPEPILAQISTEAPRKKIDHQHQPKPALRRLQDSPAMNLFARPMRGKNSKKVFKIVGSLLAVVAVIGLIVVIVQKARLTAPASSAMVAKADKKPLPKGKEIPTASAGTIRKLEEKKKLETARLAAEVQKASLPVKPIESIKIIEPVKAVEAKPVPPEPRPVVKAAVETPTRSSKKVTVSARAVNSSWIKVRADGEEVFSGTFKKGNFESWGAMKLIEISGKDIDQLEFEINGKPVPRLSRRGAPAKKIRITPEGLTVEK